MSIFTFNANGLDINEMIRQIVRMDNKTRVNMCCLQEAHFKHDIGG